MVTGYIEGYSPGYFDTRAPHFGKAETMPTMQECFEATQALQSRLAEMQAAGERYPPHLDYLAADLAEICKPLPPPEEEEEAEPEEEEKEERRVRFKHDENPWWP